MMYAKQWSREAGSRTKMLNHPVLTSSGVYGSKISIKTHLRIIKSSIILLRTLRLLQKQA